MLSIIKKKKGFTLIELLVVIAILSILLVIVLVAINPAKQTRDARNTQRRADVLTLLNGVNQYFVDNASFPNGAYTDCSSGSDAIHTSTEGVGGDGDVDLSVITPEFIAALPVDPTTASGTNSGYTICASLEDRITVAAPGTEGGIATISATR